MRFRSSLAAIAIAIGAGAAQAGDGPKSVAVDFSDLDLADPGDVSTLHRRLQQAARRVCNPEHLDLYPFIRPAYRDCYERTLADAIARVPYRDKSP